MKGTVKQFQPLIVKPVSSGLQDIGTWRWYDDPAQVVSFKAIFKPRKGDLEITKKVLMVNYWPVQNMILKQQIIK